MRTFFLLARTLGFNFMFRNLFLGWAFKIYLKGDKEKHLKASKGMLRDIAQDWYNNEKEEMVDTELSIVLIATVFIQYRCYPEHHEELLVFFTQLIRQKVKWLEAGV